MNTSDDRITAKVIRKRFLRTAVAVMMLILLIMPQFGTYSLAAPQYGTSAIHLYELGVLTGSDKGFELERSPTRLEGLIILIKLLGEAENITYYNGYSPPFSDVPDWGHDWVTYAYYEGLTSGVGGDQFGSNDLLQARSYMTFLLKALGYDPDAGDFTWDTSLDKAYEIGMISMEEKMVLEVKPFLRDHVAYLSERALMQQMSDRPVTLAENLVYGQAIDREAAEKVNLVSKDEMDILIKLFVELPDDAYDEVQANEMISRIRLVPENYVEMLIEDGTRIRLINNPMTEEPEYLHLKGVVPRGWEETGRTWDDVPGAGGQLIVARIGYSDPGEFHGSHNLELHEIGHQVDFVVFEEYGMDSTTDTFAGLTDLEKSLFSGAYYDYDEEFFAEAFTMFYLSEETNSELKRKAPRVYEYFRAFEEMYGYDD